MIARLVHKHLPEEQITHKCFAKYVTDASSLEDNKNNFTMNIDKLLQNFKHDDIKN